MIITILLILQRTMRDENLRVLIVEYVNLIVVGYWVREGVFFCTFFSTFYLFYLYATCILLRSFCAFLIQFLTYQKNIYILYHLTLVSLSPCFSPFSLGQKEPYRLDITLCFRKHCCSGKKMQGFSRISEGH